MLRATARGSVEQSPGDAPIYFRDRGWPSRYRYRLERTYRLALPPFHEGTWLPALIAAESGPPWVSLELEYPRYVLELRLGYCWDGPSGPTIDTPSFMRGSLVHDALYQLMREGQLPIDCRRDADRIMRELNEQDGMNRFRAWYTYAAVRAFGHPFARPR